MNSLRHIVQFWFQQNCCTKSNLLGNQHTGSSSFDVQTPETCCCCITCLIWRSDGKAIQPAVTQTCKGLSKDKPNKPQASLAKTSQMSTQCIGSSNEAYGEFSNPVWLYKRQAISRCTSIEERILYSDSCKKKKSNLSGNGW